MNVLKATSSYVPESDADRERLGYTCAPARPRATCRARFACSLALTALCRDAPARPRRRPAECNLSFFASSDLCKAFDGRK